MELTELISWLMLGTLLQLAGFGRWMTPIAPWLAPVLFLHFAHHLPPPTVMLCIWLAMACALGVSLRGIVPIPGLAFLALPVICGLAGALPYAIDGLLGPQIPSFWGTLIFPAAWVMLELVNARWSPYGSWGSVGYTQHGALPLIQLASVTGLWGIGFLIAWFASVVNWCWALQFEWAAIRHGVLIYSGITAAILLWGGLRIALAPARTTVRIAGIGWPKGIVEREEFVRAIMPDMTGEEREKLNEAFRRIQDAFLTRSAREAHAGAKIIVWPEANLIVFHDDEAAFIERARTLAREQEIYLVMGMATLYPGERYTFRNHAVLLTPQGETVYDYTKITAVPGFEKQYSLPGDKPIPFADTEYGRIASPICFDMDFDAIIRQVGRGRADLMLNPASDWKDIMPLHQQMAEFRAIENGTALFRIARWGGSGAVDPYGRRLAWMDDFSAADNVMVAQVPVGAGVRTLYACIGDTFAWACVAGLVAATGFQLLAASGAIKATQL